MGTALAIQFARGAGRCACGAATASGSPTWRQAAAMSAISPAHSFPIRCRSSLIWRSTRRRARRADRRAEPRVSRAAHPARAASGARHARRVGHQGLRAWSLKLPHQIACEDARAERRVAVLSGPTFAREVGAGLPTAMTVASPDAPYARRWRMSCRRQFPRSTPPPTSWAVEIGGAVKNALAVGAGLSDGLGFGANTRVALITRGLKEMTRLGVALGAQRDTFMGLAGLGDLVLTCTDDQSRQPALRLLLAAGRTAQAALAEIGQAVEVTPRQAPSMRSPHGPGWRCRCAKMAYRRALPAPARPGRGCARS